MIIFFLEFNSKETKLTIRNYTIIKGLIQKVQINFDTDTTSLLQPLYESTVELSQILYEFQKISILLPLSTKGLVFPVGWRWGLKDQKIHVSIEV